MQELQKKTITAQIAAFNAHDAKKVADTYSADAVASSPAPDGWKDQKKDDIEKMHAKLFEEVDGIATGVARVFQKGDTAIVEWVATGTSKKTGKKAGFRAASVMWFDDAGLIKKEHVYLDGATIAIQSGMAPGKARDLAALPTGDAQWIVAKGDPSEDTALDFVKNGWPVQLVKKDRKGYEGSFTPDYVHEEIASPYDYKGHDAAMKEFDMLVKALPDMSITVDNGWGVGSFGIVEFTVKGTQRGPLGPLKATNKPMTIHGLDVDEIKDGKLAKATSYSNAVEFLVQLGVMPDPAKMGEKKDAPPAGTGKPAATAKPPAAPATPKK
jgi:ketosteroid isomerase-like protein